VLVDKIFLETVLSGPPPEKLDVDGDGYVYLISVNEWERRFDGEQLVGLSFLVPRLFQLLNGPGWKNFATRELGEVATP
jgi:hypothetical protein